MNLNFLFLIDGFLINSFFSFIPFGLYYYKYTYLFMENMPDKSKKCLGRVFK